MALDAVVLVVALVCSKLGWLQPSAGGYTHVGGLRRLSGIHSGLSYSMRLGAVRCHGAALIRIGRSVRREG